MRTSAAASQGTATRELAVDRIVLGGRVVIEVVAQGNRRQLVFRDVHGGQLATYLLAASPQEVAADADQAAAEARRREAERSVDGPVARLGESVRMLETELRRGWWTGIRDEREKVATHAEGLRAALERAPWLSEAHSDLMTRAQRLLETADARLAERAGGG